MMGFWRRHRRKIFVAAGALGCGYAFYKLYDTHKQRVLQQERECEAEELIKAQLQLHFENIQRISETTTLPHAMISLRSRIAEELDLSRLTEKLMLGKGQPSSLQPKEKLELWERLKILSFSRTATSLWTVTALFLFVRVQVNIVGRHLYFETARGLGTPEALDEANHDSLGHQQFLETADYLSNYGISKLILDMQNAATEVVKDKQLRDPFSMTQLHETIIQILELFMSSEASASWISYLIPDSVAEWQQLLAISSNESNSTMLTNTRKLEQLVAEAWAVLTSTDFKNIMYISLRKVVDGLMEDLRTQFGEAGPSKVPLAKFLPRIVHVGPLLLEEPSNNRYIGIIRGLPEVELFYTCLYANAAQA